MRYSGLILLLLVAAGCASAPAVTNPMALEGVPYDAAWDASLRTVIEKFNLSFQDQEKGIIRTEYRPAGTLFTFWASDARDLSQLFEETLNETRRMAIVKVERAGAASRVSVEVYRERNTSLGYHSPKQAARAVPEIRPLDSGAPSEQAPFISPQELYIPQSSAWLPLGRDENMELRLMRQIIEKANQISARLQNPKENIP